MTRPEPPLSADSPEELLDSVQKRPNDWLTYLRNAYQHTLDLENQVSAQQATITAERQSAHTEAAERDGIIRYQKQQFDSAQQEIKQLAIEKAQLAAAASPTVQTPQRTATPITAAEVHANGPIRATAPATALSSRTTSISDKLPDLKEFDGTRQDLP